MRYMKYFVHLMLAAVVALGCSSCVTTDYDRLPHTGFISHYEKNTDERVPFVSFWDDTTTVEEWNSYVAQKRVVYFAPVTLNYLDKKERDAAEMKRLEDLRTYFDTRLAKALQEKAAKDKNLVITRTPVPGAARVEVAILSACSTNTGLNAAAHGASALVSGGGFIVRTLFSDEDANGHIAMGARMYAPNGKLVCEVADFEYGTTSVTGQLLVDTKDFRPYAYQRQTIDHWADEFATLATTPYEKKVSRPLFSLNPF